MGAYLHIAPYLWVGLGGAFGSVARFWMAGAVDRPLNVLFPLLHFPVGTASVNVLGSFVIGLLAGMDGLNTQARLLLMVGVCGGFTTFSTFSLQTFELLRDGLLLRAGANILLSVLLCLAATWAGLAVMQRGA